MTEAQTATNPVGDAGQTTSGQLQHSKYWAFISYSHKEMDAAKWLHQALERYRVPRRLIGRAGRDGDIPRRLFPVFRDQDELAASSSLPKQIQDALYSSRTLIVVCTPAAAKSKWVDEEIRTYKTIGRGDRILALIVSGEPFASSQGAEELECFPRSLRHVVTAQGEVTAEPAEPLAADIRGRHAQRDLAKLRIIAGVLGLPYDELRQRDRQRRFRQRVLAGVAALTIIAALSATWLTEETRRTHEVTAQTIQSLTNQGQSELLDEQVNKAAALLGEAYRLGGRDTRLRVLLANALKTLEMRAPSLAQSDGEWTRVVIDSAGTRLVGFGRTGAAKLWEPATGRLIKELDAHTGRINAAQFSPDGRLLFTAGDDHRLAVWDSNSGKLLKSAQSHDTILSEIIVSGDGRWIVTFAADKTVFLWPVGDLEQAVQFGNNFRIASPAAFSPSDLVFVGYPAGEKDHRSLLAWKLGTGKPFSIASENPIESFAFTPNGDLIFIGDNTGTIRGFRADTGAAATAQQAVIRTEAGPPVHISFLGDVLLVVDRDGIIQLWDSRNGAKLKEFKTGLRQVRVLDSREGVLALLSTDATPRLMTWDVRTGLHVQVDLDGISPSDAVLDPGHHLLFTVSDGAIAKWDFERGPGNYALARQGLRINGIDFSPDGKRLLTADDEGYAVVWDTTTKQELRQLDHRNAALNEASFFAQGRRIMDRGGDGTRFFDGETYALRKSLEPDPVLRLFATSPALPPTVAVALRSNLMLWQDEEKSQTFDVDTFFGEVTAMTFSADGTLLAVGYGDGALKVYDMSSRKAVMSAWEQAGQISRISFAPRGDTLVGVAAGDPVAIVWSVGQHAAISRLSNGSARIEQARFSPDGSRVITANADGTAKIYEARSGRLLMSLEGHGGAVLDATFSPDGTLVATSSEDGFARVWDAETGYLVMPFKAPGRINGIAFRPTNGMMLALATSRATAFLWDIPAETRPPEEISAIVGRESNWRLERGKLIRKAAIAHADAPGDSKGTADAERVLRTPEEVVNAFISALESADNEATTKLLAKNHKFWALIRADGDERRGFAKLFKDCKIAGTEFRSDQLAAITTLACPIGELAIWTVKEGDGWKFQNFGARPKADEKAK